MIFYKKLLVWIFCCSSLVFLVLNFFPQKLSMWKQENSKILSSFIPSSRRIPGISPKSSIHLFSQETQKQRKSTLQRYCEQKKTALGNIDYGDGFLFNTQQKIIYCRIPKVACTTWKRVFLLFEGYQKTLTDIPKYKVHNYSLKQMQRIDKEAAEVMTEYYYSFMFSRHPHDRLFSAYRNKFMDPKNRTYYIESFGPYMVYNHMSSHRKVDDYVKEYKIDKAKLKVTFEQFVRFVLQNKPNLDGHWQPQTDICQVCNFTFNYIGKFETMNQDSKVILGSLNLQNVYAMFSKADNTVYTKKTTDMLKEYYGQLPKELLPKIYEYYKGDFEAFGYDPHYYIKY